MVFVLLGTVCVCMLFGVVEAVLRLETAIKCRKKTHPAFSPVKTACRRSCLSPMRFTPSLPDRDALQSISPLADHFADRFREVVQS